MRLSFPHVLSVWSGYVEVPADCTTLFLFLFLFFVWYPCMAINVSVQYNGGLFPDIILLNDSTSENPFNAMKMFRLCSL